MRPLTLLVIDDHALVRESLVLLLRGAWPDAVILHEGEPRRALVAADQAGDLDLVLMDLMMPLLDGIDLLAEFRVHHPAVPVLILSAVEDPAQVRRALAAGAMGYVPKSAGAQTLLAALRLVLAGETYVPRLVLDAAPAEESPRTAGAPDLTPRQVDVLRLLAQGCSNKQIARGLGLAEKSVKAHVTAILRILQVENRTQAAERARNFALV